MICVVVAAMVCSFAPSFPMRQQLERTDVSGQHQRRFGAPLMTCTPHHQHVALRARPAHPTSRPCPTATTSSSSTSHVGLHAQQAHRESVPCRETVLLLSGPLLHLFRKTVLTPSGSRSAVSTFPWLRHFGRVSHGGAQRAARFGWPRQRRRRVDARRRAAASPSASTVQVSLQPTLT